MKKARSWQKDKRNHPVNDVFILVWWSWKEWFLHKMKIIYIKQTNLDIIQYDNLLNMVRLNTFPHSLEDVNERVLLDIVSISWFISYEEDTLYSLNEIYCCYSIIHEYLIQVYSSWPWPGWCGAVAASSCIKGTASTNSGPDTLANSQQQQWMSVWTHLITHIGNKSMKSMESAFSSLQVASLFCWTKTDKKCLWKSLWSWKNPERSHTIDRHGLMENKALDQMEMWNSGGPNWCRGQLGCRIEKSRISILHISIPDRTENRLWGAPYQENGWTD